MPTVPAVNSPMITAMYAMKRIRKGLFRSVSLIDWTIGVVGWSVASGRSRVAKTGISPVTSTMPPRISVTQRAPLTSPSMPSPHTSSRHSQYSAGTVMLAARPMYIRQASTRVRSS